MTFARFLSAQGDRTDWIGDLARAAAKDTRFPREPLDMHDRIRLWVRNGASTDVLHAFQAALDEWHGAPYSLLADDQSRREGALARTRAVFAAELARVAEGKRVQRNARRRELRAARAIAGKSRN